MNLFYSYSHKDEDFRITLEKFLVTLRDSSLIQEWHDRKILAGDDWGLEIQKNIDNADVIVLLISQDYLASSACAHELEYAFNNRYMKTIIPIILKPSTWKDTKCGSIQALPKDGKAISSWSNQDEAWLDVYSGIKSVIQKKKEVKYKDSFLNDIKKTSFVSISKHNVTLLDLFIWPEFKLYNVNASEINVEGSILLFSDQKSPFSLIKGEELSGKTSIARHLFFDSVEKSINILLLDGDLIYKTLNFDEVAEQEFYKQYNGEYSEYKKLNNRLLVIDKYHHKISTKLVEWARNTFNFVLVIVDDEEYMLYYKDDELFAEFNIYSIRKFSSYRLYELIQKWKKLDQNCCTSSENFDLEIDNLEEKVKNIINSNHIVPSYPFYILSILQAFEGFMPSDYQITAYGHCYAALITSQLIKKGISPTDIGDCFNFLTYIAYEFYKQLGELEGKISKSDYEGIKRRYKEAFIIKNSLIQRIEDVEYPIIRINDHVRFEYPYIYYFFIGKYIAEKSDSTIISKLCETVYRKDSANILIFTIHHTTNTILLDEIQLHCMCSFDKQKTATLTKDETSFMDSLISEMPDKIVNKKSISENRMEERKKHDEISSEDETRDKDEKNAELIDIQKAFKIIEVLGQIIKNRAGTFDRNKVRELLLEVEELGFRVLGYLLCTLKDPEFSKWMEARLIAIEKEKNVENRTMSNEFRKKYIEKNIQVMGMLMIISMIQKTFYSLCTEKILEVQHTISDEKAVPAYDFIDLLFTLSYEGLKIDYAKKLSREYSEGKNNWASKTLSVFLQRYMNTHTVDFKLRQQICTLLKIEYIPNRAITN